MNFLFPHVRGCTQKFPDWVDNETNNNNKHTLRSNIKAKLTRLTHKIAIQLHLVAQSCSICSFNSRRPVRKLVDAPSYKCGLLMRNCSDWVKLEVNCQKAERNFLTLRGGPVWTLTVWCTSPLLGPRQPLARPLPFPYERLGKQSVYYY
jgi:hypothetical protein